jgi:2-amino-4-hydroxy-6-hydroxymethyldihydropteridine diphosphokinase
MKIDTAVALSLGSNLGDRADYLQQAVDHLQQADWFHVSRVSEIYETDPVGPIEQSAFYNIAVTGETSASPLRLLEHTMAVEEQLGRDRDEPVGGPRTLDIDILLYGEFTLWTRALTLPHPRMAERRFVLEPLCAIAPDWKHPNTNSAISGLLTRCTDEHGVRNLHQTLTNLEQIA